MCSFIHNLAAYVMMSQHKQNVLFFMYLGGLILNLALCATLIPRDPLLGTALSIVITKAAVAVASTGYCQRTIGLIKWRAALPVLWTTVAGALLYAASQPLNVREVSEALALAPFAVLGWTWWKQERAGLVRT